MGSDSGARRLIAAFGGVLLVAAAITLAQGTLTPDVNVTVNRLLVTVTFELPSSDPFVVFDVSLAVTDAAGRPVQVTPASLSGDVRRVKGGRAQIVWNAGRDFDFPLLDQYKYTVGAVAVVLTGTLAVQTDPPGVTVSIDGEVRGTTGAMPLIVSGVKAGPHAVVLSKPGYLENRIDDQAVQVRVGETTSVTRTLTALPVTPATPVRGPAAPPSVESPKSGGMPKWVLPVAGGGAAAAVLGLKGKGAPSGGGTASGCTFSLSPVSFPAPPQAGGSVTVTVGVSPAGCTPQAWTASVPSSSAPFVHVSTTGGTGSQSIVVTVDANPPADGAASRSGSATIAGIVFPVVGQTNAVSVGSNVPGNVATFAALAGVTVVAGQKLTMTASGTICTNSPTCSVNASPGGSGSGSAGSAGRLPGAPSHSLVCGIAGQAVGDLFFVGSSFTTTAPASGVLFCGLNEPIGVQTSYDDNVGTWTVTVTIGG